MKKFLHAEVKKQWKLFVCIVVFIPVLSCRNTSDYKPVIRELFPVYVACDTITPGEIKLSPFVPVVDHMIPIEKEIPLQKKLEILADSLSKTYFNGLTIRIEGIDSLEGLGNYARIHLMESPGYTGPGSLPPYHSWYDYFQGTTGGGGTGITLRETFLQREYPEKWIDGILFFYQGDSLSEWDHVHLSGYIPRK